MNYSVMEVTEQITALGRAHRIAPGPLAEAHALNGKLWREGCPTAEDAMRYVRKLWGLPDPVKPAGPPVQGA